MEKRSIGKFKVVTPKHELEIKYYSDVIEKSKIKVDKQLFLDLCKKGCVNYDKKYSCPPFSPLFNNYVKSDFLLVVMFVLDLNQFDYKEYFKIKIGNAVLKSQIEKVMRKFGLYLSTGACRLCKPCKRKLMQPCKYPSKRMYSLESLGVDCNDLCLKLFNVPLKWYKDKKAPPYTSVVCAVPLD